MSQTVAAAAGGQEVGYLDAQRGLGRSGSGTHARVPVRHWAGHRRLLAFVVLGAAAAGVVGYLVAQNPHAAPAHIAVPLRVAIIAALVAGGACAQTSTRQVRLGALLVAAGLYASVWLLNGSSDEILFSVGMLLGGLGPAVFAYLTLAYPSGRLRSSAERRLLLWAGGAMFVLWTFLVLTSLRPPVRTPLLDCGSHCPHNALFLGSSASGTASVARVGLWVSWIVLAVGVPVLLARTLRHRAEPVRRSSLPVEIVAIVNATLWLGFAASRIADSNLGSAFGAAYVETAAAVPIAILVGLFVERLTMGRALATFVTRLTEDPHAAPQALLASVVQDASVEIAYYDPSSGAHVDGSGAPVALPSGDRNRAVVHIERDGAPIAAVSYDADLSDQAAFVEAAGAAALVHVQATRLEADLTESNRQLAASRSRLVEAADAERQRIERDLHDGVQQHIVGLRLKLELAADAIRQDPVEGERMIASIGRQLDELLAELRSFAAGIYPSVLTERGLKDALESAVRKSPIPVSLHTFGLRRYRDDIEVAVYFCCLEAIQNIAKHAGADPDPKLRLWQIGDELAFDVRDSGDGFDSTESRPARGLTNMHDRVAAVGGQLNVSSTPGHGTWVRGRVPVS